MKKRLSFSSVVYAFLTTSMILPTHTVWAAGGKGLPQLNPAYFAPQIFWLIITFGVFYILMAWIAVPRIERVLSNRSNHIQKELNEAIAFRNSALQTTNSYETTLTNSRHKAQDVISSVVTQQATLTAQKQAELAIRLNQKIAQAEVALATHREKALNTLAEAAVPLVADLAQKLGYSKASSNAGEAVKKITKAPHG